MCKFEYSNQMNLHTVNAKSISLVGWHCMQKIPQSSWSTFGLLKLLSWQVGLRRAARSYSSKAPTYLHFSTTTCFLNTKQKLPNLLYFGLQSNKGINEPLAMRDAGDGSLSIYLLFQPKIRRLVLLSRLFIAKSSRSLTEDTHPRIITDSRFVVCVCMCLKQDSNRWIGSATTHGKNKIC